MLCKAELRKVTG